MTIEQLEHIACVARTGSISRAAAELHMSQPALSRSIRRLEDELGCGLLRRTANRSALTEAGRIAADYADDLLRTYRRMRDELLSTSDALAFSTEAATPYTSHQTENVARVAVPLSDASARATFYLVYRTDGQGKGSELIERVLPRLSR